MKKYTLDQFRLDYPNDDACLDKLFKLRYEGLICPTCDDEKQFVRTKGRRSYNCVTCGFQVYPTAGTIFEKTSTPLLYWFHAIYLQTTTRNGVSAKELERNFNICYKTALRMAHQIKKSMANKDTFQLSGIVECDETLIGGKMENKHTSERKRLRDLNGLHSNKHMAKVFGMVERRTGFVRVQMVPNVQGNTLKPILKKEVNKEALIITDSAGAYKDLKLYFKQHEAVNHDKEEYVKGNNFHTNTIEGFWSQLKRTIKGTHIQVTTRHLQKYVDEVAFRYQHRFNQDIMFDLILKRIAS